MKKYLILVAMALLMASCSSEQRALNQMRNLTNDIEQNGQYYNADDWKDAYADYKRIDSRIDPHKLTTEQHEEYGQLKGRCVSGFAKSSVQSVKNAVSQGVGIIEGIIDGLTK